MGDPLSAAARSKPEDEAEAGGAGGGAARGGDHRRGGGDKVVIVVMDPEGKKINLKVGVDDDCESPAPARTGKRYRWLEGESGKYGRWGFLDGRAPQRRASTYLVRSFLQS